MLHSVLDLRQLSSRVEGSVSLAKGIELWVRVYPNPLRERVVFKGAGYRAASLSLLPLELRGRLVRSLDCGSRSGGEILFHWDGSDGQAASLPSCIHCYQLARVTGGRSWEAGATARVLLVR